MNNEQCPFSRLLIVLCLKALLLWTMVKCMMIPPDISLSAPSLAIYLQPWKIDPDFITLGGEDIRKTTRSYTYINERTRKDGNHSKAT
jgi:hypothetical protein